MHIPFCARRCGYCSFATWADRGHLIEDYLDALCTEIGRERGSLPLATSIFIGGGTPSILSPPQVGRILSLIDRRADAEISIECNPETVDHLSLRGYRAAGVNRISIGAQSMVQHVLGALGRSHDVLAVVRATDAARSAGFENLNLDLIYGAVGESMQDWHATLDAVLRLGPDHVSAYALTVEPGTPLCRVPDRYPDPDDQADKYLLASEMLEGGGLSWYEISNFAQPHRTCRHNQLYWRQGPYRGFGCSAHSHRDGRRWWNVRDPERYIEAVAGRARVEAGSELLDPGQRREEALQLALRTRDGVPAGALDVGHGIGQVPPELVERVPVTRPVQAATGCTDQHTPEPAQPIDPPDRWGGAEQRPGTDLAPEPEESPRLRLTPKGRLLANEVSTRLGDPGATPSGPASVPQRDAVGS